MSQLQPTSEEEAARRATLRDLGGENRARITLASDGGINKWKPGDESSLLKRPGFRPGTDSHIISGTKAWGDFHLQPENADDEAKQMETAAGGLNAGQTHRLNRLASGSANLPQANLRHDQHPSNMAARRMIAAGIGQHHPSQAPPSVHIRRAAGAPIQHGGQFGYNASAYAGVIKAGQRGQPHGTASESSRPHHAIPARPGGAPSRALPQLPASQTMRQRGNDQPSSQRPKTGGSVSRRRDPMPNAAQSKPLCDDASFFMTAARAASLAGTALATSKWAPLDVQVAEVAAKVDIASSTTSVGLKKAQEHPTAPETIRIPVGSAPKLPLSIRPEVQAPQIPVLSQSHGSRTHAQPPDCLISITVDDEDDQNVKGNSNEDELLAAHLAQLSLEPSNKTVNFPVISTAHLNTIGSSSTANSAPRAPSFDLFEMIDVFPTEPLIPTPAASGSLPARDQPVLVSKASSEALGQAEREQFKGAFSLVEASDEYLKQAAEIARLQSQPTAVVATRGLETAAPEADHATRQPRVAQEASDRASSDKPVCAVPPVASPQTTAGVSRSATSRTLRDAASGLARFTDSMTKIQASITAAALRQNFKPQVAAIGASLTSRLSAKPTRDVETLSSEARLPAKGSNPTNSVGQAITEKVQELQKSTSSTPIADHFMAAKERAGGAGPSVRSHAASISRPSAAPLLHGDAFVDHLRNMAKDGKEKAGVSGKSEVLPKPEGQAKTDIGLSASRWAPKPGESKITENRNGRRGKR